MNRTRKTTIPFDGAGAAGSIVANISSASPEAERARALLCFMPCAQDRQQQQGTATQEASMQVPRQILDGLFEMLRLMNGHFGILAPLPLIEALIAIGTVVPV